MSLLFDISPDDSSRKKRPIARARSGRQEPAWTPIKKEIPHQTVAIKAIGWLDHTHECIDERCRGSAHDIIREDGREWLIQCCFCNSCQWVPVINGHLPPKQDAFVFRGGRFAGLTIDQAIERPHGEEYVAWAAREHTRPAVRAACQTFLDSRHTAE